jgi:ABC-type antimicrobial peptide transport system permease subunit
MGGQSILIRTRLGPEAMARSLVREVKAIDANLAAGEVIGIETMVDRRTWSQRAAVTVLAAFGGMALLLAGIGLYGVMSYSVSQSRRELGLRMALGANPSNLLRIVVSRGLGLALAGAAAGAGIALVLTRLMGDLLYKVDPRDPAAFASAGVVMILTALAASFLPALRAARTDPVTALRN